MILETIAVGALAVNCYIVGSEAAHEAAVIDPGDDAARITSVLHRRGLNLKYIILTHAHFDHAGAAKELFEKTFASVMVHEKDAALLKNISVQAALFGMNVDEPPRPDIFLKGGDKIEVGDVEMEVIETPGHTPGGISLYIKKAHVVFTGDTLFWGSIGRTDLPGGDYNTIIHSLKDKLGNLPDDTKVYPGHGDDTTIGFEKKQNPYFE
ncbi:MAG: MBL fold metallo-hydrolase [Nitrospirota bacterium]